MIDPATISRFKKERFLLSLSEDVFRDEVVRPLYLRRGLRDGRDLCGPLEKGKDALFISRDSLGMDDVYVVQTKKGHLNMAKKATANVVEAITQLKTALETKVPFVQPKQKRLPTKVILCASGKINESAREHIASEIHDPRIIFMDADVLIPEIDSHYPEFWFGIDAQTFPYLRAIKKDIQASNENLSISDILPGAATLGAATDEGFVELHVFHFALKTRRSKGQSVQEPFLQAFPVPGILNRRERLFLILGHAGAGKSTSLKRLAYVLAQRGLGSEGAYQIPVMLRAIAIAEKADTASLVELCAEETNRVAGSDSPSFTPSDLLSGKVTVLIDALDEISDEESRKTVLERILEFHGNYPSCQIIITSRDYRAIVENENLRQFNQYRLSPINYKQAAQIITRFQKGRNLPTELSQEILRRLQDVHGMELNPLLVTVFAATSEYSRQDIPANITELFKKFTEMMLGRWDATKGLTQQYHAPLKDFLLRRIAFEMQRRRTIAIDLDEFKSLIQGELTTRGHLADVDQLLDEILNRSALLRVIGNNVEFRHLLIQEFFAGRGIPSQTFLETIMADHWWQRAIVFYFGENPGDSNSLHAIRKSLQSTPLREVYRAALTTGLALQACYLVPVAEKIDILRWVIEVLAVAANDFLTAADPKQRLPVNAFVAYYLRSKDSVALSVLGQNLENLQRPWEERAVSPDEKDFRLFWIIVGLIESGDLDQAESLIKKFHPSDTRLLFALHLGCYAIQHLRVIARDKKRIAERVSEMLADKVVNIRDTFLTELRTELLEIRKGEIQALDKPRDTGEGK